MWASRWLLIFAGLVTGGRWGVEQPAATGEGTRKDSRSSEVVGAPTGAVGEPPAKAPAQELVEQAISNGRYELAEKLAIVHFRPDLHCQVLIKRASDQLRTIPDLLGTSDAPGEDQLQRAEAALSQVNTFVLRSRTLASQYEQLGCGDGLAEQVEALVQSDLRDFEPVRERLEALKGQAKPLEVLMAQPMVPIAEIERLAPETRLVLGLHLVDRGEFELAAQHCFSPVQPKHTDALGRTAACARELVEQWHVAADNNRKWDNLVNKGLDVVEALLKERPDQALLASWMACLAARLARDHYDVPRSTIEDTLRVLDQIKLPAGQSAEQQVLEAKLRHERFLLSRRAEDWAVALPPVDDLPRFEQSRSLWYAAESALIAAAAAKSSVEADELLNRAASHVGVTRAANGLLADSLQRRLDRFVATRGSFDGWLQIAQAPDYRDRRGTVLPDVLLETRAQLALRVRAGFEELIGRLLQEGQVDAAFQHAQRAKALAVGRTLTSQEGGDPRPAQVADLLASRMLATGEGAGKLIPHRELFIEYFWGPTRAWAFHVFAPGDAFEALQAIELDRGLFEQRCRQVIEACQKGENAGDPGDWLLTGSPKLSELWGRLIGFKAQHQLRRVAVAPDGPLCYVPLQDPKLDWASLVTVLPTAAVLVGSEYLDSWDLRVMWDTQRGELSATPPTVERAGDRFNITLRPGMSLAVSLRDLSD